MAIGSVNTKAVVVVTHEDDDYTPKTEFHLTAMSGPEFDKYESELIKSSVRKNGKQSIDTEMMYNGRRQRALDHCIKIVNWLNVDGSLSTINDKAKFGELYDSTEFPNILKEWLDNKINDISSFSKSEIKDAK